MSLKRKLGFGLLGVLLLLLLLEGVVRVRFYFQQGTFSRIHIFARDAASGLSIPVPGLKTATTQIDSRGFRNPELEVPKPRGRVRMAFLGATYCAEASSNTATWPNLVTQELQAAHPETSLDFVNAGGAGYTLSQVERCLEFRVKSMQPDAIVLYEATNEFSKDSREAAKEQGVYVEHADRENWLTDVSLLWYLVQKNLLVRERARAAQTSHGHVRLDLPVLEHAYRERFAHLIEAAKRVAPVVVVATFAQRTRRDMTPEQQRESCITHAYFMPYLDVEGILGGFEAYNRAIRAAARDTGVVLVEGEHDIPPDAAHFADSVHFTDAGCRWQAQRILKALESSSAFKALLPH